MPLNIQDTTYAGEASAGFKVKAIIGADTIAGGHVYLQDGIKKKHTIKRMFVDDMVQDRVATPVVTSTLPGVTIDGRTLEPKDYMVYDELNPRDFEQHWDALQLNPTLIDRTLPATAESVILQEVLKTQTAYIERALWQSDTTRTDKYKYFDGFIKKFLDSSDVLKVTSSLATLTASNIADKLEACYALLPDALLYDPNMKFFVSYRTGQLWQQWQQDQTYKGVDKTSVGVMAYKGKRVVPVAGMINDCIVVAKGMPSLESNLWVGLNSKADEDYIQFMRLQANSELWFYKVLMKLDVQFGWGQEIIMYNLNN